MTIMRLLMNRNFRKQNHYEGAKMTMNMNAVLQQDMENVCIADFIAWNKLKGKTVLVTAATAQNS